jgi:uncharacterized protein YjbJ (UPF0337 family)
MASRGLAEGQAGKRPGAGRVPVRGNWLGGRLEGGTSAAPPALSGRSFNRRGKTMNWDRIEGNWKQFKGKVKQQWGDLTDDELDKIEGRQEELSGLIQKRYGKSKDEANSEIDTWLAGN